MNIIPLLALLLSKTQVRSGDREIAQSLVYVIEKFFVTESTSFILILSCQPEHRMEFFNIFEGILFGSREKIKTQILVNSIESGPSLPGERIYNLLLVDSWESFRKIDPASKVKDYDINEYYYIFLRNFSRPSSDEIQLILEYCWRNYIINVNIQVEELSGEIVVYSYFPFTKSFCAKVVPVKINAFRNGSMTKSILFPPKLLNMFNCTLKVATWNVPPYLILHSNRRSLDAIGGFEGNLLKQLSKIMNFDIQILVPPNNERKGLISANYTSGAARMLQTREADLSLGNFWVSQSRSRLLTASHCYFQSTSVAVLLSTSSNYEPMRALWFPFKPKAFTTLLTTILLAMILVIGLTRILGNPSVYFPPGGNGSIWLNFIACTLSLPSSISPRRNSIRIFFITWVLFVQIIRTKYEAMIYHLIRNNLFRRPPSTLSDALRLNYTLVLNRVASDALLQTSIISDTNLNQVIIDKNHGGEVFSYLEEHPKEKLLTFSPSEFLWNYLVQNHKVGVLTVLKESFVVQNSCIFFTKHSFLVNRVNFLVQRINAAGIMDAWVKKSIDLSYLLSKGPGNELTIGQRELKGIYYVCGGMLVASFVVFCLEIISIRCRVLRKIFQKL